MADPNAPILIEVMTGTKAEAKRIAKILLRERLIACANIVERCSSLYWWKGRIEQAQESILLMKTTAEHWKTIERRVRELHSYERPCVLKIAIEDGSEEYLEWIGEKVL